jgi:hypothetical protein
LFRGIERSRFAVAEQRRGGIVIGLQTPLRRGFLADTQVGGSNLRRAPDFLGRRQLGALPDGLQFALELDQARDRQRGGGEKRVERLREFARALRSFDAPAPALQLVAAVPVDILVALPAALRDAPKHRIVLQALGSGEPDLGEARLQREGCQVVLRIESRDLGQRRGLVPDVTEVRGADAGGVVRARRLLRLRERAAEFVGRGNPTLAARRRERSAEPLEVSRWPRHRRRAATRRRAGGRGPGRGRRGRRWA